MKWLYQLFVIGMTAVAATGCRTPNPYVLSIDPPPPADRYEQFFIKTDKPEKVAVHVYYTDHKFGREVADELNAKLSETIGSLAFFELVPRGGVDPLVIESMLSGRSRGDVLNKADYVISAKAVNIGVNEQKVVVGASPADMILARKYNIQPSAHEEMRYTVSLSIHFQFFQCAQNRSIRAKTISRTAQGLWDGVIQAWLMEATRECAQEFAQSLGGRYAPEARVLQTRGGHEVARISLGANYGLTEGIEVNFFTYITDSPFMSSEKRFKNIIGTGRVFLLDEDSAWVEVFDYDDVCVEQGMFVEVRHQQMNEFRWRYFLRKIGKLFKY